MTARRPTTARVTGRRGLALGVAAATACSLLAAGVGTAAAGESELSQARAATAAFHQVGVAEAAGYGRLPSPAPLHECIDADLDLDDDDGLSAMGIHWVNLALLDDTVSADRPEVLVYEPGEDGRLRLVAVEYVVFEDAWGSPETTPPPQLFGEDFMHVAAPNRYDLPAFYALHAWVWRHNPSGLFAGMNPAVSC